MKHSWFKPRGYKHFDAPVGERFALAVNSDTVRRHSWSPLIHYVKSVKRYKPLQGKTISKERSIMYASHRDACILSKYSYDLGNMLESCYTHVGLENSVVAYRKIGKTSYHFSATAAQFAMATSPCVVVCFDITGFFDNLDHSILKDRLREILSVREIPDDWYKVYRHVTTFRKVDLESLCAHPKLKSRTARRDKQPVATISEVKCLGIQIDQNPYSYGIPQGTPISSSFSNLYMLHLDLTVNSACLERDALYQRYSDDLIIICKEDAENELTAILQGSINHHKLAIHPDKCERVNFNKTRPKSFQYLGFDVSPEGAVIRASSLSRQVRKFKRHVARIKRHGSSKVSNGLSQKIFTKKLRRRFCPVGVRNFSRYGRRSATTFASPLIRRQLIKLERRADRVIRALNNPVSEPPS